MCISSLLLSTVALATPVAQPIDPPRTALVIGNAGYESVGALKNPRNDAQDICRELTGMGFKTSCYFDVKTRVEMRSLIQDYVQSLPGNAISVFYYAGHAVQVNGENYLIPTGAELRTEDGLVKESVGLAYIMRELRRNQHYLNVLILDACRNNPMTARGATAAQGLAPITDVPDATMVLYATAADETTLDGQGRNGIMTKNVLANLHEPGTVDDLFKRVSLGVQKDTQALGHPQKPALYTNFAGQYCLVRCTDVEMLQREHDAAAQRISDLEARVASGDPGARAELAAAKAANDKLLEAIRQKDEEAKRAEAKAKDRENKSFVPPAF